MRIILFTISFPQNGMDEIQILNRLQPLTVSEHLIPNNKTTNFDPYLPRWAKVTTLRALTIFLETLLQLEKRLGGWTVA
jgi:hypothetical protein